MHSSADTSAEAKLQALDNVELPLITQRVPGLRDRIRTAAYTNRYTLRNIFLSCAMEYAVPGLIPYLCKDSGSKTDPSSRAFWLTTFFFLGSMMGRVISAFYGRYFSTSRLNLLNVCACTLLLYMLWVAHAVHNGGKHIPPFQVSCCFVALFSLLHGFIVTRAFVRAAGLFGITFTGLANQLGALFGSLVMYILVHIHVVQ